MTLCRLTALSLLALLGLRHPIKLLPVLLFESTWKLLCLALVALPRTITGNLDAATAETAIRCSLVVVILAVTHGGTYGGPTCTLQETGCDDP